MSGETARRLSRYRSPIPLLAFTSAPETRSQLALTWGVETFLVPFVHHTDDMVRQVEAPLLADRPLREGRQGRHRRRLPSRHRRLHQRPPRPPHRLGGLEPRLTRSAPSDPLVVRPARLDTATALAVADQAAPAAFRPCPGGRCEGR